MAATPVPAPLPPPDPNLLGPGGVDRRVTMGGFEKLAAVLASVIGALFHGRKPEDQKPVECPEGSFGELMKQCKAGQGTKTLREEFSFKG